MGSRTMTRRISTAVAVTGLTVGAGVGLTAGAAHAQEPRADRPSVAQLCAAAYGTSTVSEAAHRLHALREASTSAVVPLALPGLRCGQVARPSVSHPAPWTDKSSTDETTPEDTSEPDGSQYGDDDSHESGDSVSGDEHNDGWGGEHHDGYRDGSRDGWGGDSHDGYRDGSRDGGEHHDGWGGEHDH